MQQILEMQIFQEKPKLKEKLVLYHSTVQFRVFVLTINKTHL